MGRRNFARPCEQHGRRRCWDCRLHAYRLEGARNNARTAGRPMPETVPPLPPIVATNRTVNVRSGLVPTGRFREALALSTDPPEIIADLLGWTVGELKERLDQAYVTERTAVKLCRALHVFPAEVGL